MLPSGLVRQKECVRILTDVVEGQGTGAAVNMLSI